MLDGQQFSFVNTARKPDDLKYVQLPHNLVIVALPDRAFVLKMIATGKQSLTMQPEV